MTKPISGPFCCIAWLLLASVMTAAQSAPGVAGRVEDPNGAPLPGVTVTVRRPATGAARTTTTDAQGRYRFDNVEPGHYEISASLAAFSTIQREFQVTERGVTIDFTLTPGGFREEVTVLATRLAGSEQALSRIPGSVDILHQEWLVNARVFTTSEALRKIAGLTVRDEEGLGLRPNIGIRGLPPTRSTKVLLLEDGVPTTYAPYGDNASYYHPPIERFERVEVLKGSGQIAYGPATVGGIVNYITPDPPAGGAASITVAGGSRGYLNGHASVGERLGRTGVLVDVMRKQSDGARENQHSDLNDVTAKLVHQLSAGQSLTIKANYYGEDSQVGYSGLRQSEHDENPRQNPFVNDRFLGDRVGLSATHHTTLGRSVAISTTAYWQSFRRHWWRQSSNSAQRPNDAADPRCGGMANLNTTCGNEGRLRQYYLAGVEPRGRAAYTAFGVPQETDFGFRIHGEIQERRQENGDTPEARSGVLVENNRRETLAFSGFAQHRLLLERWTLTPGVRVEHMRYERLNRLGSGGAGVSGETTMTTVVPGVGMSFAASHTTLFAGVHRGFAPPRVEDVIGNTTGSVVELAPEQSWNYEAGVRASIRPGLAASAAAFRMDYENQIVPASLAGGAGATLTNGGATLHQGIEGSATLDGATLRGRASGAYLRAAVTWVPVARFTGTRFSSVSGFERVSVSGNRLPYAPAVSSSVTIGFRHTRGLDLQLEAQSIGDQFGDDLNTIDGTPDGQRGLLPGHVTWNAAASWTVPGRDLVLFAAVKNLRDTVAIVDRSRGLLPSSPRLVQVGIRIRMER